MSLKRCEIGAGVPIVLDANILIRAVLGNRVRGVLASATGVDFLAPESCFDEARRYLPDLLRLRLPHVEDGMQRLTELERSVRPIPESDFSAFRREALARIGDRDPDDWGILALSLERRAPIWTEDHDFFGVGVPTWTTARVHLFTRRPHHWPETAC